MDGAAGADGGRTIGTAVMGGTVRGVTGERGTVRGATGERGTAGVRRASTARRSEFPGDGGAEEDRGIRGPEFRVTRVEGVGAGGFRLGRFGLGLAGETGGSPGTGSAVISRSRRCGLPRPPGIGATIASAIAAKRTEGFAKVARLISASWRRSSGPGSSKYSRGDSGRGEP